MNETKIGEGENEKYHFDWPLCRVPEKLNQISEDSGAPGDLVRVSLYDFFGLSNQLDFCILQKLLDICKPCARNHDCSVTIKEREKRTTSAFRP